MKGLTGIRRALAAAAVTAVGACGADAAVDATAGGQASTTAPLGAAAGGESTTTTEGARVDTTAVPPVEVTVTPSGATSSAVVELPQLPPALCCVGEPVAPATYELPGYWDRRLTLEVPDGWRSIRDSSARFVALVQGSNVYDDASRYLLFLAVPPGEPAADIVADLAAMQGITPIADPVDAEVAGQDAVQLDARAEPNPDFEGSPSAGIPPGSRDLPVLEAFVAQGFHMSTATAEARLRFVLIDVGVSALLAYVEAPEAEFNEFAEAADTVLRSLTMLG